MSANEFQIAPHLERALDAMSKDLSIDPQALVNQAVFAWLRINGYVAPSAATAAVQQAEALAPTVEKKVPAVTGEMSAFVPTKAAERKSERALEAVPTEPAAAPPPEEKKKSEPALPPVAAKKKSEPALEPVAPPPEKKKSEPALASVVVSPSAQSVPAVPDEAAAPVSSPSGGQLAAMARMKEIAADLEKLTKRWPDWVAREEEEDDEDEEDSGDEASDQDEADQDDADQDDADPDDADQDDADQDESDEDAESDSDEQAADEREDTGDHSAGASTSDEVEKPESRDPFEADLPPEVSTGENEVQPPDEEPVGESTVVLRSVPIVLYLEREGADPVRVDGERFIIGRGPTCDLVIDSPRVSREHVAITRQGIRYFLKDLNSSNGTWMGEDRIGERELESGDVISLGNEPITFILRGE